MQIFKFCGFLAKLLHCQGYLYEYKPSQGHVNSSPDLSIDSSSQLQIYWFKIDYSCGDGTNVRSLDNKVAKYPFIIQEAYS